MRNAIFIITTYALIFLSCNDNKLPSSKKMVYIIQPFEDMNQQEISYIRDELKKTLPNIFVYPKISLPPSSYYSPRKRYKADSLIQFLSLKHQKDTVLIGLTKHDISTQSGKHIDWGVMGLAYCPGNACIASTFRLNKKNTLEQLYKVVIHELAHTQGLPHCNNKSCYLRDANGKNPTDEETEFCCECKDYLLKRNWKLN